MDFESRHILYRIFLDVFVILCVGVPIIAYQQWGVPNQQGYSRDDASLMQPYRPSSVPTALLAGVGVAVNVAMILAVEFGRSRRETIVAKRRLAGVSVPAWLWDVYQFVGVFLFGMCCQQLTTTVGKYAVGRLRPHFFDVCDPLPAATVPASQLYISDYTCQGLDQNQLMEVRLSFPSAHSAFAAYAGVYLVMYVHARFTWGALLLRHGVQFAVALAAWYAGLSRIRDNKHHASDVAAGFLIGTLYAVLVFTYVTRRQPERLSWVSDARPGDTNDTRPPVTVL